MIDCKSPEQIEIMRQGGQKLGTILQELLVMAQPGVNMMDIEKMAMERIKAEGAIPSFTTVEGYKWATCLCINDEVVHGIPIKYSLKDGDVLTIDIGLVYEGFHTDTAWTKIIHPPSSILDPQDDKVRFLKAGEKALWDAIAQAKIGNRIGHISQVAQQEVESAGYSIVKSLVGHGVGRNLHEEPQVPNYLRGAIENTMEFIGGETIAVEVIYAQGEGTIEYCRDDGWTLGSRDRSLTAVFEHTVALTPTGPQILTKV